MIRSLEKIKKQITNLILSVETFLKVLLLSKSVKIPTTKEETIWILANGPSLNNDLHLFHHYSAAAIGAVNYFANHSSYELIKPSHYFLQAPEFWLEDLLPSYLESRANLFEHLATKTNWPLKLFIPINSKKYQKNYQPLLDHTHIEIIYYNDTPVEGISSLNHYFFNRQRGMPRPHNILIPSIMLSLNMGFKKLYLLGVDHSWLPELSVDEDNNAMLSQKHFYDKNTKAETMKKLGRGQRHLHEILHKFYLTFKGYFIIKDYATAKGVTIYNCTEGSFIDAFDKVAINTVFPVET